MLRNVVVSWAMLVALTVAPGFAAAQSSTAPNAPLGRVKGIIAKKLLVNCATSSDSNTCQTRLVITAGPVRQVPTNQGHPTATVGQVTVVIMPHTPIVWGRFNRTVTPNQIKPGDAVDIDYRMVGGENVATRVDVTLQ